MYNLVHKRIDGVLGTLWRQNTLKVRLLSKQVIGNAGEYKINLLLMINETRTMRISVTITNLDNLPSFIYGQVVKFVRTNDIGKYTEYALRVEKVGTCYYRSYDDMNDAWISFESGGSKVDREIPDLSYQNQQFKH